MASSRSVELRAAGEKTPLLPSASLLDPKREHERRQREELLSGSGTLERATARLDQSHRLLVETEEVGGSVLSSLQRQRAVLRAAAEGLEETNSELKLGDTSLRSLYLNGLLNKACTYLACGLALLVVLGILYAHLRSLGKVFGIVASAPPPPRSHLGR